MEEHNAQQIEVWKEPTVLWLMLAGIAVLLGVVYFDGLERMVDVWSNSEEYGHGFLLPLIAVFLIWQKKDALERLAFPGSWVGLLIVLAGIFGLVAGELSTLYIIIQYSFLLALLGVVVAFTGWGGTKLIWAPLALLVFMIPLPNFLYANLSSYLQLISSSIGVDIIRLFGISVYLEGNVIDLGVYKLQVVEACSGLRYLFPLSSLAFIAGCIYKGKAWQRVTIFLSSIPITIFMNSLRIGIIGILVEYGGIEQAEGFLHYFEGWVIFMACMALLIGEMWLFARFRANPLPLSEIFNIDPPAETPADAKIRTRALSMPLISVGVVLLVTTIVLPAYSFNDRVEKVPPRASFTGFPMELGEWSGSQSTMESIYIDVLKFDDYIVADYFSEQGEKINFYVAYYNSQRKGVSAHSPRTCIPGGGWQISDLSQRTLDGVKIGNNPLRVNRVVIQKGEHKQLVYYWFQQRGRIVTNEYLMKWFLFWDSLTKQRTDGALIRLTIFLTEASDMELADKRMAEFSSEMVGNLVEYVPD